MLRGTPPQPLPREGLGSESEAEAEVGDGRLKLVRLASGALLAATIALGAGERTASAEEPPKTAPPAGETNIPAAQPQGAIVVAAAEGAGPAARALALETYRDAALRPPIDEATARVLAGDPPAEGAPPRLKEIAELRASIARAGSDVVTRRLLASLGAELGARLVVPVTMDGSRPVARVLRTSSAVFDRIELGATIETAPDGARTFRWPGTAATLRVLVQGPSKEAAGPPAPKAPPAPEAPQSKPFWQSAWFWGSLAGVAAVGITVGVLSKTTGGPGKVHLQGMIGP
jgi:hypothetical protein